MHITRLALKFSQQLLCLLRRLLEEILKATPDSFRARDLLGIALSSLGRKEEGNVQFRKALEIEPNFAAVLKNLALNDTTTGSTQYFQARDQTFPNELCFISSVRLRSNPAPIGRRTLRQLRPRLVDYAFRIVRAAHVGPMMRS